MQPEGRLTVVTVGTYTAGRGGSFVVPVVLAIEPGGRATNTRR